MREILFRGKRIDDYVNDRSIDYTEKGAGEWVYGDIIHRRYLKKDVVVIRTEDSGFDNYSDYDVDPSTIGQYTGLTANGKKIFEGDILKITDEFGNSVIWSVDCKRTAFSINQKGVNYSTYLGEYDTGRCDIEIIGNIYDTPELFEVKE